MMHISSVVIPNPVLHFSRSSQYNARLSAHQNYLIVDLIELPDNRRFRRRLPNDLIIQIPSVTVVFVVIVFKV
jgi:hypothetical protein